MLGQPHPVHARNRNLRILESADNGREGCIALRQQDQDVSCVERLAKVIMPRLEPGFQGSGNGAGQTLRRGVPVGRIERPEPDHVLIDLLGLDQIPQVDGAALISAHGFMHGRSLRWIG